jgi:ATP-dependent helicase/nuclease subunit B
MGCGVSGCVKGCCRAPTSRWFRCRPAETDLGFRTRLNRIPFFSFFIFDFFHHLQMSSSVSKTLFTGPFRALERCFLEETSAGRKADPLSPLIVLIPGQLLRLHLRRALARYSGGHANVRFLTLLELAHEIAEPELRRQNLRRLSDAVRGPLVAKAIEEAGELRYFARVARRSGFRHALWHTLAELRTAGVTLTQWRAVLARFNEHKDAVLLDKLTDLSALWQRLEALQTDNRYVDAPSVLALAAKSAAAFAPDTPAVIYGFDTLTGLEKQAAASFTSRRRSQIFLPCTESAASDWVRPLRAHWLSLGFSEVSVDENASPTSSALASLQRHLFDEDTRDAATITSDDRSVLVVSAPTRDREVDELSREILFSPLTVSQPRRRIGVLLRDHARYADLLRAGFARTSIAGYFHQCQTLGEQSAGRALRRLVALLDQTYHRRDVMEFLLSTPVKWPPSSSGNLSPLPAAQWNHFSLLAGITDGESAWLDGLQRLHRQWERDLQEQNSRGEESAALSARIASLNEFTRFLNLLFNRLRDLADQRTWEGKIARLWSLFVEIVEPDESTPAIADELARVAELDALGWEPATDRVTGFIEDILRTPAARTGRFQATEPTVCTYEEGLGLCFDDVLLCGLVEKEIPRFASEDPLLLDAERLRLQDYLIGVTLPLRTAQRDRERFLFHSAAAAARSRLVLSYPRFERSEGRERLPSVYLLKTLEALTGRVEDYDALQRFIATPARGRFVPAARLRSSHAQIISNLEATIERLATVVIERDSSALLEDILAHPALARALRAETKRFGQPDFSVFDGLIENTSLLTQWQATEGALQRPLSPTRMEHYAACPFRYLAHDVLALDDIEEASLLTGISALTRGSLIHEILHDYYQQEINAHRLPWQDDAEIRLKSVAESVLDKVSRETLTGPALLWRLEQARLQELLAALLRRERNATEPFVPVKLEEFFEIAYEGTSTLHFRGKMDRVDLAPEGRARVIDYKTGNCPKGMQDGSLNRGRALQLPLYRLAAQQLLSYRVQKAEYWYLSDKAQKDTISYTDENWKKGEDEFRRVVTTIAAGIASAHFYPYPEEEKCASCPAKMACGSGRWTNKWHNNSAATHDFLAIAEGDA